MDKTVIAGLLRRARLIGIAYRAVVFVDSARNYTRNRQFRLEHPGFVFPPAGLVFPTSGTTSYENYYNVGSERSQFVIALGAKASPPGMRRVCEWGCGTGKTLRHLAQIDPDLDVYGTDADERVIRWCRANIPEATFMVNDLEPPLPFEDDFFDMLYSYSVYTHLPPDLQFRWLAEELRVVRPGGLVLLTVHGDAYKNHLTPAECEQYASKGIVVHGGTRAGVAWFSTFNSPHWVEHELLRGHEIVYQQTYPEGGPTQDVWVIRKPLVREGRPGGVETSTHAQQIVP
jgi:SAM-dependent methyltransferase